MGDVRVDMGQISTFHFNTNDFSNDSSRHNLSLANIVPVNAHAVDLEIYMISDQSADKSVYFFPGISTDWNYNQGVITTQGQNKPIRRHMTLELDSNRCIQYCTNGSLQSGTNLYVTVCGYLISENPWPQRSGFRAYRSGSNQSVDSDVWTPIQLNSKDFDEYTEYSISTYKFVPFNSGATFGTYIIAAQAQIEHLGANKYFAVGIRVNGDTYIAQDRGYSPVANCNPVGSCSCVYKLNDGDYVELVVRHNHGSARDIAIGVTAMSAKRIG